MAMNVNLKLRLYKDKVWKPIPRAEEGISEGFMDTYDSLGRTLRRLGDCAEKNLLNCDLIRDEARTMSVLLRKFILDKKSLILIQKFIRKPDAHPLKRIPERIGCGMTIRFDGVIIPNKVENEVVPMSSDSCIELYDLVGFEHGSGFHSRNLRLDIFNTESNCPLNWGRWKNQKIMEVETAEWKEEYSIEDLSRHVANKEGAHMDFGKKEYSSDADKKKQHREWVVNFVGSRFSLTYPHWVTLCVGFYLHIMLMCSMSVYPELWKKIAGDAWSSDRYVSNPSFKAFGYNTGELSWRGGFVPLRVGVNPGKDVGLIVRPGKNTVGGRRFKKDE